MWMLTEEWNKGRPTTAGDMHNLKYFLRYLLKLFFLEYFFEYTLYFPEYV